MDTKIDDRLIIRQREAARMIGITPKHLRHLERAGEFIPRVQLGTNSVGYRLTDIEAWLDANTKNLATPDAA